MPSRNPSVGGHPTAKPEKLTLLVVRFLGFTPGCVYGCGRSRPPVSSGRALVPLSDDELRPMPKGESYSFSSFDFWSCRDTSLSSSSLAQIILSNGSWPGREVRVREPSRRARIDGTGWGGDHRFGRGGADGSSSDTGGVSRNASTLKEQVV